jgi:hypothetical protein
MIVKCVCRITCWFAEQQIKTTCTRIIGDQDKLLEVFVCSCFFSIWIHYFCSSVCCFVLPKDTIYLQLFDWKETSVSVEIILSNPELFYMIQAQEKLQKQGCYRKRLRFYAYLHQVKYPNILVRVKVILLYLCDYLSFFEKMKKNLRFISLNKKTSSGAQPPKVGHTHARTHNRPHHLTQVRRCHQLWTVTMKGLTQPSL